MVELAYPQNRARRTELSSVTGSLPGSLCPGAGRLRLHSGHQATCVSSVALTGAVDMQPMLHIALQDQLGLRLRPTRGPVDVLVITNVERPKS